VYVPACSDGSERREPRVNSPRFAAARGKGSGTSRTREKAVAAAADRRTDRPTIEPKRASSMAKSVNRLSVSFNGLPLPFFFPAKKVARIASERIQRKEFEEKFSRFVSTNTAINIIVAVVIIGRLFFAKRVSSSLSLSLSLSLSSIDGKFR